MTQLEATNGHDMKYWAGRFMSNMPLQEKCSFSKQKVAKEAFKTQTLSHLPNCNTNSFLFETEFVCDYRKIKAKPG